MERYNSAKGKVYTAGFIGLFVLMLAGIVMALLVITGVTKIVLLVFYLLVIALECAVFFGTYYEFGDEKLLCRCGPFREEIPYQKIKTATKCKGYVFSMALSELRIELKYGPSNITGAVFISPEKEDEFLEKLVERNPAIEVYEA